MALRNRNVIPKPGKSRAAALTITHPNAAGTDIGSASHFVAVPPDRDDQPVREFPSFTAGLNALADWLEACGVDTVAMESTGVYGIPLFELLESRGFTVLLVNARHVKNVSGRKSDVLDCQWLQQLMTYGLLRGAFRPAGQVCVLRALWRQRAMLLRSQGRHVQHMQKALTQMNIQLTNVLSDVVGETGQKILRAIVAGERDGQVLGAMKNVRVRASADEIANSLQSNWRTEHLFALKQALGAFDFVGTQLSECGQQTELQLQSLQTHDGDPALGAYFRRMCSRMDKPKAITAAAHKLARLIYTMLTKGEEYTDQGQDYYEERYRERALRALSQRAAKWSRSFNPPEKPIHTQSLGRSFLRGVTGTRKRSRTTWSVAGTPEAGLSVLPWSFFQQSYVQPRFPLVRCTGLR